jgi:hypothetical protein
VTALLLVDAIDAASTLLDAVLAWIVAAAFVVTVCLYTAILTGAWAIRRAWRAARRVWTGRALRKPQAPVSRPQTLPRGSRDAGTPHSPAQAPSRPAPSWAHADKEAA